MPCASSPAYQTGTGELAGDERGEIGAGDVERVCATRPLGDQAERRQMALEDLAIAFRDGGGQDHRVRRARLDVDQDAAREAPGRVELARPDHVQHVDL